MSCAFAEGVLLFWIIGCEFAARLPERMKIEAGVTKWCSGLMQKNCPVRAAALEDWLAFPRTTGCADLRPLLMDTLSASALDETNCPARGHRAFIKEHMERRANLGYHLWGCSFVPMVRHWNIQTRWCASGGEIVARAFTRA